MFGCVWLRVWCVVLKLKVKASTAKDSGLHVLECIQSRA